MNSKKTSPVLIVNLATQFGGAEIRVIELAGALKSRIPFSIAVLKSSPLHHRLVSNHIPVIPFSYKRADPRLLIALIRTIVRGGYEVVDAHNPQSQLWGLLAGKLAGAQLLVSTVHSSYKDTERGIKRFLYERVLIVNKFFHCHFITVSVSVTSYLRNLGIKNEFIHLIHNAIHLKNNTTDQNSLELLRDTFGWNKSCFVVIVVARLEPVKGIDFLIEAIKIVSKNKPWIRCLIVGTGRLKKSLELQVNSRDLNEYVRFAGFRSDILHLLSASDAFCLPSLSEGLPYALLEACSCKLPVLATKVGGMAECLTHNETAILTPPGDPYALAAGLAELMDNPDKAKKLGESAYRFVADRFSFDMMVQKTLDVYNIHAMD